MKCLKISDSRGAIFFALFSAVTYAICIPCIKLLDGYIPPVMTGAFLYLGAGLGLSITSIFKHSDARLLLTKKEFPFMVATVVLDISAVTFLVSGISRTESANAALLGNFELVATSVFAYFIFKECISKKLLTAIILITFASIILTFEGKSGLIFNSGSVFVLLSCLCWGMENNCTKIMSIKDTRQITFIKGCFTGLGSLVISMLIGEVFPEAKYILLTLILGFISYGISVCMYIYAQRLSNAPKTGAFYSSAPFIAVLLCLILLGERPDIRFYISLPIMIAGTYFAIKDTLNT